MKKLSEVIPDLVEFEQGNVYRMSLRTEHPPIRIDVHRIDFATISIRTISRLCTGKPCVYCDANIGRINITYIALCRIVGTRGDYLQPVAFSPSMVNQLGDYGISFFDSLRGLSRKEPSHVPNDIEFVIEVPITSLPVPKVSLVQFCTNYISIDEEKIRATLLEVDDDYEEKLQHLLTNLVTANHVE